MIAPFRFISSSSAQQLISFPFSIFLFSFIFFISFHLLLFISVSVIASNLVFIFFTSFRAGTPIEIQHWIKCDELSKYLSMYGVTRVHAKRFCNNRKLKLSQSQISTAKKRGKNGKISVVFFHSISFCWTRNKLVKDFFCSPRWRMRKANVPRRRKRHPWREGREMVEKEKKHHKDVKT